MSRSSKAQTDPAAAINPTAANALTSAPQAPPEPAVAPLEPPATPADTQPSEQPPATPADTQPSEQPQADTGASPAPEDATSPNRYQVTAPNRLRLRPTPGTNNPEILLMPYGTVVTAVGESAEVDGELWLQVAATSGTIGYAMSKHLQKLN